MSDKDNNIDSTADNVLAQAKRQDKIFKISLIAVIAGVFLILLISVLLENVFTGWRHYQRRYHAILKGKADDDLGRKLADDYKVQVRQIYVPELGISDRCVSCHRGIDDPRMTDVSNPFKAHPGDFLENHDIEKFACTSCHNGQGRAIVKDEAHGKVAHWLYPRLEKEEVYSNCSKWSSFTVIFDLLLLCL